MKFDHVALNVSDIARSVQWYKQTVGARVLYQDDSWAMLEAGAAKIALTLKSEHPSHIAFEIDDLPAEDFLQKAKRHRDGSISRYATDPDGNAVEWIYYPRPENRG